jgi:hypothetical protein
MIDDDEQPSARRGGRRAGLSTSRITCRHVTGRVRGIRELLEGLGVCSC